MFAELQPLEIGETLPEVYNGIKLFLVVQGCVTVCVSQESHVLRRNELLLVNRYEMCAVTGAPGNAVLQLSIPFEYLQQEGQELLPYSFCLHSGTQNAGAAQALTEIRQILYYMLIVQHNRHPGHPLELRANLFRLMHLLLQHFKRDSMGPQQPALCTDANVQAVISAIHEQFRQPLSLEHMARQQFLSTQYLSRLFKQQTGVGFLEYLTQVRLESARKDLLYTADSIIQIALHNGFPSAQAFATHFKRLYGTTPTDFRGSFDGARVSSAVNRCRVIPFQQLCGLSEIQKHLGGYEQETGLGRPDVEICVNAPACPFTPCDKTVKIGSLGRLLQQDVRHQLMQLQEKIQFQYLHAYGIFQDGINQGPSDSMFWGSEYTQIFPFLEHLGLCPILRIDVAFLVRSKITPEQAEQTLRLFLSLTNMNGSHSFTSRWLYEFYGACELSPAEFSGYYQRLYGVIQREAAGCCAGMFLEWKEALRGEAALQEVCAQCPPDFITLAADPNSRYHQMEGDLAAERFIRGFYPRLFQRLRTSLGALQLGPLPVFLLEWNTLIGRNLQECASFYRAALVVEALLHFQQDSVVPAFWLSEQLSEAYFGPNSGVLSLFHCLDLKRAPFYALSLFAKLGSRLLYQADGVLATLDNSRRIVVLGFHPCYFAPVHAMDYDFVKRFSRESGVLLSGLADGDYQIKVFRLAMNFSYAVNDSESYFSLPSMNVPHYYSDPDTQEYLSAIAAPQYALLQEHIEASCKLNFGLSFNSLKLYVISKM